ncbi:hypothetical protein TNCV_443201 [Trichonephila clavipes]|nr:hypothetical protein TNCV_443201 [Trichonephila clavipes]
MTLRLIAKGTFFQLSWIQQTDRAPFERTPGDPTRLNVLTFVLGTLIGHTNGGGSKETIDCSMVPSASWDGEATGVEGKGKTGVQNLNMSNKSL